MKDVPIFFLTGWYDYFADGVMENFRELSRLQHSMKRLLVGPWPHATGEDTCGDAYFGESAAVDQRALMADWFDHWMKHQSFKMVSSTPVRFFRMGGGDGSRTAKDKLNDGGAWLTSLTWPPSDVRTSSFFLRDGGRLEMASPGAEDSSRFDYDPANPIPTLGARYGLGAWSKSCAQNGTIERPDVLAFNTKPLDEPLEVTGPVTATLWVTSDAPSADFAVKVMDVFPDGYALTLADGATRVTLRQPDVPQKVKVDLGSFSNLFIKGHSIRLYVTSSNFPKLEPNRYPAHCTILHNAAHPSSIDLPTRPVAPAYGTPKKITLMVPMRDGVELATDVYLPSQAGKFPVLVTRSPYNKNGESTRGNFFARQGYVVVAQDTRGRYASHGEPYPLISEAHDGYDTIEWAAAQPWSNGRVATTGASYLAMDQYAAAIERPPHLLAMYAAVGGSNYYKDSGYHGGIPGLGWPVWLLLSAATDPHTDPEEAKRMNRIVEHPEEWLSQSREERAKIFAHFPVQLRAYEDFYAHPNFDAYWRQTGFDTSDHYARMKDVPILFVSGWYDSFADATLANFDALRAMQKSPKRLIMGPWPHGYGKTQCGDIDFGPRAELDELAVQLDWFDHWLKGTPLRDPDAKPITYFRMGTGWLSSDSWPPKGTQPERWYLHDAKTLGKQAAGKESSDTFAYDPAHPVKTLGARHGAECIVNQPADRAGVISYISDPLTAPKDVTGKVRVTLWVSSDAPSADFTAKLIDVYPDGYAAPLLDGATRVPHIKPGEPQQVVIELGTTSEFFAAGHRIRLDVSSSSFPKLEPNPNPAHDVVYHGGRHGSYLEISTNSQPISAPAPPVHSAE
jgi:putative CocE/NonD family hydrolase